ncbi:hypothetical protein E4U41_004860 [Claviceps citrina]|nr:hypothetical protein E4U41_004860 [Claviceps citrina]
MSLEFSKKVLPAESLTKVFPSGGPAESPDDPAEGANGGPDEVPDEGPDADA